MENSLIQILIICAYIGVLFLISAYVKYRSSGSVENYVLAGRKLTTPLVMVSRGRPGCRRRVYNRRG